MFALSLVVISIFTPLLSTVVQRSVLNGADQLLGFFFGVARGALLVAVAFFVYQTMLPGQTLAMVDASTSAGIFVQTTDVIQSQNPEEVLGWLRVYYDQLIGACTV